MDFYLSTLGSFHQGGYKLTSGGLTTIEGIEGSARDGSNHHCAEISDLDHDLLLSKGRYSAARHINQSFGFELEVITVVTGP